MKRELKPTLKVHLAGGQSRLREAIFYVCKKCVADEYFGLTKLNKILWHADFNSFAERGQPVTGRTYQKLEHGPAPIEMLPLLEELVKRNELTLERTQHGEFRPIANVEPQLKDFSASDIEQINRAIQLVWGLTATEVSKRSHGIAWKTRAMGDPIPYEMAYFSDQPIPSSFLKKIAENRSWKSE